MAVLGKWGVRGSAHEKVVSRDKAREKEWGRELNRACFKRHHLPCRADNSNWNGQSSTKRLLNSKTITDNTVSITPITLCKYMYIKPLATHTHTQCQNSNHHCHQKSQNTWCHSARFWKLYACTCTCTCKWHQYDCTYTYTRACTCTCTCTSAATTSGFGGRVISTTVSHRHTDNATLRGKGKIIKK